MENKKIHNKNFIQKNPNAMGAIYLIIITIVLMLFDTFFVWLISLYFSAKSISKASRNSESKKLIGFCYVFIMLIVILLFTVICPFVIDSLNSAA